MRRLTIACALTLLPSTWLLPACQSSSTSPQQLVSVTRPLGSWRGAGNMTVGDVASESGRFRIQWETRNEHPAGHGAFRLTVRSAVSGRPIQVVADYRGEGKGLADFEDTPRIYDFMVDSANVEWSFTVDEVTVVHATEPSSASPPP